MILSVVTCIINLFNISPMQTPSTAAINKKALAELNLIVNEREKFIKVHAAEYLIWTGHTEGPLKEFLKEEKLHSTEPKYRVVIWRVLAQAEKDPARKKMWLSKMYDAYKDMNGPDRTHASEALAKLKQPVAVLFPEATAKTLESSDRHLQTYALWASSYGSQSAMNKNREKFVDMALTDHDPIIRRISAYILRKMKCLNIQQWDKVVATALSTPADNELYVTYLTTALVTAPNHANAAKLAQIHSLLVKGAAKYVAGQRIEIGQAFAEKGTKKDLPLMEGYMSDKDSAGIYDPKSDDGADVRAAAAYAILEINSRQK